MQFRKCSLTPDDSDHNNDNDNDGDGDDEDEDKDDGPSDYSTQFRSVLQRNVLSFRLCIHLFL